MPRFETKTRGYSPDGGSIMIYQTNEHFTLRMVREDGVVIYADGFGLWRRGGWSWIGEPPSGWDVTKAVRGSWEFAREPVEVDRS